MDEIKQMLQSLGLNQTEAITYVALLKTGQAPASMIAQRTNLPRSTARYTCQQLSTQGLVTMVTKNGTQLFTAKDPVVLNQILEMEQLRLRDKEVQLNKMMGELKDMYNPASSLPKVHYFEGPSGIIEMLNDVLEANVTIYGVLNLEADIHPEIWDYVQKIYLPRRKKLKQKSYTIMNNNGPTRDYAKTDQTSNRTTLFVDSEDFPFKHNVDIYGNKVAFYNGEKTRISGVVIEDENMMETQLSIFKLAWAQAAQGLPKSSKIPRKLE